MLHSFSTNFFTRTDGLIEYRSNIRKPMVTGGGEPQKRATSSLTQKMARRTLALDPQMAIYLRLSLWRLSGLANGDLSGLDLSSSSQAFLLFGNPFILGPPMATFAASSAFLLSL